MRSQSCHKFHIVVRSRVKLGPIQNTQPLKRGIQLGKKNKNLLTVCYAWHKCFARASLFTILNSPSEIGYFHFIKEKAPETKHICPRAVYKLIEMRYKLGSPLRFLLHLPLFRSLISMKSSERELY